jgi:hypothetical protein
MRESVHALEKGEHMNDPFLYDDTLYEPADVTIRLGDTSDREAIARLGELDEQDPGYGPHLVADEDGEIVAALSLTDGVTVGDPFRRTAQCIELLRFRAAQLGTGGGRRRVLRTRLTTA